MAQDGVLIHDINTPRMQSLLAYLLLHRRAPQQRRDLAFMLWPDSSEVQARTNLRKLLYLVRQTLPDVDTYLHFEGQMVKWQEESDFSLDVDEFHAAVRTAALTPETELDHLERAYSLYRGDLLPGCYDEWIEPDRESLRAHFARVLGRLISLREARRDYPGALNYARRLLKLDELNENAYRQVMRLHSLNGDRAGALRVYHSCVTTLSSDLSVEPGRETREMYERLMQDEPAAPGPSPDGGQSFAAAQRLPPLVGREQQWQALLRAWESVAPGQPACLVISGEAGIGKTRLAEELLRWIRQQGYPTASARCFAAEGSLTYAPVVEWLRSDALRLHWKDLDRVWQVEIARLVPELQVERPDLPQPSPLIEDWQRRRLFDALLQAVSPAQLTSIALFIDDLQWCDGQTLSWMHYLLRSAPSVRLMLVATLRVEELSSQQNVESWLDELRQSGRLLEIELGPLSAAETAELATSISGQALNSASSARLFADTEGYPLFVIESVRMADEIRSKTGLISSATAPAIIAHRLAQLSPAARDLAGVAAIIGRSFTYSLLAKVNTRVYQQDGGDERGDGSDVSLVRNLDELWQRRIIREHGSNGYDFSHDKIREAAYNGLSAARRRLLHCQAGEVLAALIDGKDSTEPGLDRDELVRQAASHFDNAGQPERAIPYYYRAAGQDRQMFANDEALRCFHRALELLHFAGDQDLPFAARIREECGDLLLLMTRRKEARSAFEQALAILPEAERISQAALFCKIGNTWRDEYHFEESLPIYARALQILGEPPHEGDSDALKWWQCWIQTQIEIISVHYWLAWVVETDALIPQLTSAIERCGTLEQRANLFAILASNELRRSRYGYSDQMVAYMRFTVEAYKQAGSLEDNPAIRFRYGMALLLNGALDEAEPEMNVAMHQAEQRGDLSLLSRCLTYLTILHRKRGSLGRVIELASRALKTAEAANMPEYVGAARANLAWASWRTGDLARAREHSQVALSLWNQTMGLQAAATPYYWTAIWPLIAIAITEGNLSQAVEHVQDLLQPHRKSMPALLTDAMRTVLAARDQGQDVRPALASALMLAKSLQEF